MFRRLLMTGSATMLAVAILPGSSSLAATFGDPVTLVAAALAAPPNPEMLSAIQRDLNLSADGALQRLGREQAAHGTDERVRKLAGSGYAGAWLEDNATVLRVAVTRRGLIPAVRAAGATPILMRYNLSELEAASERLKSLPFPSASLTGWRVDLPTNRVVIVHLPGGRAAGEKFAAAGRVDAAMVRYESRSGHSAGTAEVFAGTRSENERFGPCTLGFAVQPIFEPDVFGFLTAGHCGRPFSLVFKKGGTPLGVTNDSTFFGPSGAPDHGWVRVTNGDITQPKVFVGSPNPRLIDVRGSQPALQGESVCRVGSVSFPMYACGTITGTGISDFFTYDSGAKARTVSGLSKLSVCATPGDSGGPVITAMEQAQGTTIGGPKVNNQLLTCASNPAGTEMFFQPIAPTLLQYGLKLFQPRPPAPTPLRISKAECDREQTGPGWVCHAMWTGGVDLATASWSVSFPRRLPYVITHAASRVTEAHFACFFDEAEPDYQIRLTVRDAVGTEAHFYQYICQW